MSRAAARVRKLSQRGFTLLEVLISIMLCSIAVIGIMGLYRVQARSSGYSRRMTEASLLAEDQFERIRLVAAPSASTTQTETGLDERGLVVTGGMYTRISEVVPNGTYCDVKVTVSWDDDGYRELVMRGRRTQ